MAERTNKPASKAEKEAAKNSKHGTQQVQRGNTADRDEVRRETTHRQGHPK